MGHPLCRHKMRVISSEALANRPDFLLKVKTFLFPHHHHHQQATFFPGKRLLQSVYALISINRIEWMSFSLEAHWTSLNHEPNTHTRRETERERENKLEKHKQSTCGPKGGDPLFDKPSLKSHVSISSSSSHSLLMVKGWKMWGKTNLAT